MTDEERLVDIGIRRQLVADIYELRPHDDWEKDQDRLLNDDVPWLIARVRALEAQAAALVKKADGCCEHVAQVLEENEALKAQAETATDIQENADRLALACDIVLMNLAHPGGASRPIVHDHLRSRLYTYAFARDGEEAAKRYSRGMSREALDAALAAREEGEGE